MTEVVRWPPEEVKRREDYMRFDSREFNLRDPYTWSYPAKGFALCVASGLFGIHYHNLYSKKPWYFSIYPRMAVLLAFSGIGYGMGVLREKYNKNRDAYVNHYVQTHPEDFERLDDIYGRPFSQVLLPWYPKRTMYRKFETE